MSIESIEQLESRRLLTVVLQGGQLHVLATAAADTVQVSQAGADIDVFINDIQLGSFPVANISHGIRVFAGDGDDQVTILLDGFAGRVTLDGGAGDDTIYSAGPRRQRIYGDAGADNIDATGGSYDTVYGGDGNDSIQTHGERDYISGDDGDDFIDAGPGSDHLFGGDGNDSLNGGTGSAIPGDDFLDGGPGADNLNGHDGNDTIYGDEGRDLIDGGTGNDLLFAQGGLKDTLSGGPGQDQASLDNGPTLFDKFNDIETVNT